MIYKGIFCLREGFKSMIIQILMLAQNKFTKLHLKYVMKHNLALPSNMQLVTPQAVYNL